MPLCPFFSIISCILEIYSGALLPKTVPHGAPEVPHKKIQQEFLGIRKWSFGHTQTVVWVYANSRLGVRKR